MSKPHVLKQCQSGTCCPSQAKREPVVCALIFRTALSMQLLRLAYCALCTALRMCGIAYCDMWARCGLDACCLPRSSRGAPATDCPTDRLTDRRIDPTG